MNDNLSARGELLVYQNEDGDVKLDVRLQNETVWLTQQMMAELFQTTQQNISLHIRNIYEEGELAPERTHKKFLSVQQEGVRQVRRNLDFHNLDMIISVGYRVKSLNRKRSIVPTLCPWPYALCPMLSALCPMLFAPIARLRSLPSPGLAGTLLLAFQVFSQTP